MKKIHPFFFAVLYIFMFISVFMLIEANEVHPETVKVTAYSGHLESASGVRPRPGTVALSHNLLQDIPFGSIIHLDDFGLLEVCDVMHPRKCNAVDVFVKSENEADKIGVQHKKMTVVHRAEKKKKRAQAATPTRSDTVEKGGPNTQASWAGPLPDRLFK